MPTLPEPLLLVQMDKIGQGDWSHLMGLCCPPQQIRATTGLGSSIVHQPSLVHGTLSPFRTNHKIVLFLSDHIMSQKLCGGSTKSPVFSFT